MVTKIGLLESVSDIMDHHQALANQLNDECDGEIRSYTVGHECRSASCSPLVDECSPSPSPLTTLSVHDGVSGDDDTDIVASHIAVVGGSGNHHHSIIENRGGGSETMVRHIIDDFGHSTITSPYHHHHHHHQSSSSSSSVSNNNRQDQSNIHHHHNLQQHLQQQQQQHHNHHHHNDIAKTIDDDDDDDNSRQQQQQHQHQQHHQHHQQQHHHHHHIPSESPVELVRSDITLDALSVDSSSISPTGTPTGRITVKDEHKLMLVVDNNNETTSNSISDRHSAIITNVMDDLSSDGTEVTLNQHHHQHVRQGDEDEEEDHRTLLEHAQHALDSHLQHHHHHHHHQQQRQQQHDDHDDDDHIVDHQHNRHHHSRHNHHSHQGHHHQHQLMFHPGHHHHSDTEGHSDSHETLSVIVQPHEDSRDSASQMLSPELGSVVGVVGVVDMENSLESNTYQTLTSVVNDGHMSPPGFSPSSSYATLTPLQPLPPISTMSDKFAYGHIGSGPASGGGAGSGGDVGGGRGGGSVGGTGSGGGVGNGSNGAGSNSNSSSGVVVGSFASMSHGSNSLGALTLNALSGTQSPYSSSYDKLPSMGMSMSPPHSHYASSPTHALSGMVVACDLHSVSPNPCVALSPQSTYSHGTTDLHSPPPPLTMSGDVVRTINDNNNCSSPSSNKTSRHVVCLSPVTVRNGGLSASDSLIVSDYESSYATQAENLIVSTTTDPHQSRSQSSSATMDLHTRRSNLLSSPAAHAIVGASECGGLLNSATGVITLPPINGSMAVGLSSSSSAAAAASSVSSGHCKNNGNRCSSTSPASPPRPTLRSPASRTSSGESVVNLLEMQSRLQQQQQQHHQQQQYLHDVKNHPVTSDCSFNDMPNDPCLDSQHHQQQQQQQLNESPTGSSMIGQSSTINNLRLNNNNNNNNSATTTTTTTTTSSSRNGNSSSATTDIEEINTKELAQRISAELKRYSIPQAIFAQRVLCRSQGTLSDLLRNPKPWSKLKSGRETFRRMFKWLQEPEFQRMSALRIAAAQMPQRSGGSGTGAGGGVGGGVGGNGGAPVTNVAAVGAGGNAGGGGGNNFGQPPVTCRRKEEPHIEHMPQPKKPRLVFTDLQRRTLQAIFKETKRPSKEMQVTIARQLGLEPTTVGNFFMNARRRSMDKWRDDELKNANKHNHHHHNNHQHSGDSNHHNIDENNRNNHYIGNQASGSNRNQNLMLDLDDDEDMDLDLRHNAFDLDDDHDPNSDSDDML